MTNQPSTAGLPTQSNGARNEKLLADLLRQFDNIRENLEGLGLWENHADLWLRLRGEAMRALIGSGARDSTESPHC